jgi:hypothetical protein
MCIKIDGREGPGLDFKNGAAKEYREDGGLQNLMIALAFY